MSIPILILSMTLFFVLFFGIGFLLNMLLRMTWIMAVIYPLVFIILADNISTVEYFFNPTESFKGVIQTIMSLGTADLVICLTGFVGSLMAGFTMKLLRKSGYQMF